MGEHRTQADRSSFTRAALVDAAILLLIERGWAATTSVAVCEVADVTRGALHHHYADLGELLAEALEELISELLMANGPQATCVRELVDKTWSIMGDRRFKAVMEAWWAAGNDAEISQQVRPVMNQLAELISPDNSRVSWMKPAKVRNFVLVSREAMLGLATGRATNGGHPLPHESQVIKSLRDQARRLDTAHRQ